MKEGSPARHLRFPDLQKSWPPDRLSGSLKEKLPNAFDDTYLYCEVAHLLSEYTFWLPARRFIQELFQDAAFSEVYEEARDLLGMTTDTAVHETVRRETEA
ncbi:RICTOR [Branchiostoma lanceolatum]|uniref:RICTOR protein n=1 Tax=Branchiostoma lanceolatum TaxID=7740 RepID=A0A8J9YYN4_BRALA|nr:RICTOR [Branchiostoma lanceolatum]